MRSVNGVTVTDNRYTGQREEVEIGLYYYVARWYDPALAHFIQADTVVPEAGNALAYLKYAYVGFNPLRLTDPSGHSWYEPIGRYNRYTLGIKFAGYWTTREMMYVIEGVMTVGRNLHYNSDGAKTSSTSTETYKKAYGIDDKHPQVFQKGKCEECSGSGAYTHNPRLIEFHYQSGFFQETASGGGHRTQETADQLNIHTVIHELGHAFRTRLITAGGKPDTAITDAGLVKLHSGYAEYPEYEDKYWEPNNWEANASETFANQFLGWNYDTWKNDSWGNRRSEFMNTYMPLWIDMVNK
jgi:RHS repeat-associated protein